MFFGKAVYMCMKAVNQKFTDEKTDSELEEPGYEKENDRNYYRCSIVYDDKRNGRVGSGDHS